MMKNFLIVLLMLMLSCFFIFSCKLFDDSINDDNNNINNNVEFLSYYIPGSEKALGEKNKLVRLSIGSDGLTYNPYIDLRLRQRMNKDGVINNNLMALGLAWVDQSFHQGVYMNLGDNEYKHLPLVAPSDDSDYNYYISQTANVTENGYIIYMSGTQDKSYGDQTRHFLNRFNPSTDKMDNAISPVDFALSQPEKGNDTEFAQINPKIFASIDGRYVYGHIEAFGTEGGAIHWDYKFLFRYDFDKNEYIRLGDSDDDDASITAMTVDRKYLIYSNGYDRKVLNVETGDIIYTEMNTTNVQKNSWNNYGACVGATSGRLYYKDFVNNEEIIVCSPGGSPYNALFSKDGSRIYFTQEGYSKQYLCVTDGLAEDSNYDTLGTFPLEFYGMLMVK